MLLIPKLGTLSAIGLFTLSFLLSPTTQAVTSLEDSFAFTGEEEYAAVGSSVSGIGDINGDGLADFAIGAFQTTCLTCPPGNLYVVYGTEDGMMNSLKPSELYGVNGFKISGMSNDDNAGFKVAGLGDVNGDGVDDFGFTAIKADGEANDSGKAYIIYGGIFNTLNATDLSVLDLDGNNGFVINGPLAAPLSAKLGHGIAGADFNNDGYNDIAIGAPFFSSSGAFASGSTFVIYGKAEQPAVVKLAEELDESIGFRIDGEAIMSKFGWSVAAVGDTNGDGFQDMLIGSPGISSGESTTHDQFGSAYLIYGRQSFPAIIRTEFLTIDQGVALRGTPKPVDARSGEVFGKSVSKAGDFNGDGLADIAIGAPYAVIDGNAVAGATYLLLGAKNLPAVINMKDLTAEQGTKFIGAFASGILGKAVAGAGDMDGDGLDDLVFSANHGAPAPAASVGDTYIIFGSKEIPASPFVVHKVNEPMQGLILQGSFNFEAAGSALGSAGDVNNDGFMDLLIGAPRRSTNIYYERQLGAAYLFLGANFRGLALPPETEVGEGCLHTVDEIDERLSAIELSLTGKKDKSVLNKLKAVHRQVKKGNYEGAINKLTHDLLAGNTIPKLCTIKEGKHESKKGRHHESKKGRHEHKKGRHEHKKGKHESKEGKHESKKGKHASRNGRNPSHPTPFCEELTSDLEEILDMLLCINK